MFLGDFLTQERTRAGLSQTQLEKKANVTRGFVSRVESGIRNLTANSAKKLFTVLDRAQNAKRSTSKS